MKLFALILLAGVLSVSLLQSVADHHRAEKKLRHVVSFKFKESASEAQIEELVQAFAALKGAIPQIQALEWGTNVSPEKHDKGFTHMWTLTFGSAEDRDAYLVHPDHKAFGALVGPIVADVFVIDYWARL